jgi:ribosomal RNA-processing protein 9
MKEEDDMLTKKLKYQMLEKKGKLFYEVAQDYTERSLEKHFLKGHKKAITSLQWMPDDKSVITASKDCCLIRWDLESEKKLIFKGQKHQDRQLSGHFDEPLCMAISPTGKYMITGGKDRIVRVWDIHNQTQIQTFMGHRDMITGIKFDRENDQFYTVSADRALKVWNIREMAYMDSHYGHHSSILGMDTYSKDRVISCGLDRQVIFWKINEES